MSPPVVTASEIGHFSYCSTQYWLQSVAQVRPPRAHANALAKRLRSGTAAHTRHATATSITTTLRRITHILALIAAITLTWILLSASTPLSPNDSTTRNNFLLLLSAAALATALAAFVLRKIIALPNTTVLSIDHQKTDKNTTTLRNPSLGLLAKPDYILRQHGHDVAVELKTTRSSPNPYRSDQLQALTATHLLVDQKPASAARYAYLIYNRRRRFTIPYTYADALEINTVANAIRSTRAERQPPVRNHHNPGRCRPCPYRQTCSQSLA